MATLAGFVRRRRGKPVTITPFTLGAVADADWEDENERPVAGTATTVTAIREPLGSPALRRLEDGEWSEWDAVFHVTDGDHPAMPTGASAAGSGPRPEVIDEDGNRYTIEEVGREELGLRRLYCTRKR